MDDLKKRLEDLGQVVSDTSDRLTDPTAIVTARRRFLEAPQPVSRASSRRGAAFILAATCVLCAALVLLVAQRPSALSFALGSPPAPGTVGEWISAGNEAPIVVRFSEGTRLTLAPRAKVRVTETTTRGAGVLLEQGSVEASVVHTGANTQWALRAGPFEVRVTGTRFEAAWDPIGETFEITLREGSVIVRGPVLSSERALVAGERLRISVRNGELSLSTAQPIAPPKLAPPAESVAQTPPREPADTEPPSLASASATTAARSPTTLDPAPDPTAATGDPAPSWRELASAGKYKEAFEATERAGFVVKSSADHRPISRCSPTSRASRAARRWRERPCSRSVEGSAREGGAHF